MHEKELMTVDEAAKFLSITPDTLRKYIRKGLIPAGKLAGSYRLVRSDLIKAIQDRAGEQGYPGSNGKGGDAE